MRLYLSKLTGAGTRNDPFMPATSNHVGRYRALDARKNPMIKTGGMFIFCKPTASEHSAMLADPLITYIPIEGANGVELNRNSLLSEIANRAALISGLESLGVPLDGLNDSDPVKRLLRRIVKKFLIRGLLGSDDFASTLDAPETITKLARIKTRLESLGFSVPANTLPRDLIKIIGRQKHKLMNTSYDN